MSEIPIAGPYPELRPFLPFAPSDGAVRSLGRSMGLKGQRNQKKGEVFHGSFEFKWVTRSGGDA